MPGKHTFPGFSLLELVLAMAIVAMLVVVALPNVMKLLPKYEQKAFITNVNSYLAEAWQQGLATQKIQKIVFDLANRQVYLEQETDELDPVTQEPIFKPVLMSYAPKRVDWSESFEVRQFFVQGVDELSAHSTKNAVWFFLLPGGMAQEVIINILDTKNPPAGQDGRTFSLVLNPYTVQFKAYVDFQNPS